MSHGWYPSQDRAIGSAAPVLSPGRKGESSVRTSKVGQQVRHLERSIGSLLSVLLNSLID
jgi:hypothetical protein